jgi:hypothetical protein
MADGHDPSHGGTAAQKRGTSIAQRNREAAAWARENPGRADALSFARDILPWIQSIPLSTIVNATGLSLRYCSLIRRGLRIPHSRHWRALQDLAGSPATGGIESVAGSVSGADKIPTHG